MEFSHTDAHEEDRFIDAVSKREEDLFLLVGIDPELPPPDIRNTRRKTILRLAAAEELIEDRLTCELYETRLADEDISETDLTSRLRIAEQTIIAKNLEREYVAGLELFFHAPQKIQTRGKK